MNESNISLGDKLRALRGKETRAEISKKLNVSESAIGMYENNDRVPRDETKKAYARLFGTTVGALFFNE